MKSNDLNRQISDFISKNGLTGREDAKNRRKVEGMLGKLSPEQRAQLTSVLGDPQKSQEILNSPAAKALMKKLMQ
jgi:hypothetical protein